MVRWIWWLIAIVVVTMATFPLAFTVPVVGIVAGVGLGWWAARTGLTRRAAAGVTLAGWVVLTIWHVIQHFQSEIDRSGELAGSAVFLTGAALLAWALATVAKRGDRFAAAVIAVLGGLAVLQASCYVLVRLTPPNVLVSPWLWYVGSMFPYGRWSNEMWIDPDGGYLESNDWFQLADSLVMYPAVWTFLLTFLLTDALMGRAHRYGHARMSPVAVRTIPE